MLTAVRIFLSTQTTDRRDKTSSRRVLCKHSLDENIFIRQTENIGPQAAGHLSLVELRPPFVWLCSCHYSVVRQSSPPPQSTHLSPLTSLLSDGRGWTILAEGRGRSELWLHVQTVDHWQQLSGENFLSIPVRSERDSWQSRRYLVAWQVRRRLLHFCLRQHCGNRFQSENSF